MRLNFLEAKFDFSPFRVGLSELLHNDRIWFQQRGEQPEFTDLSTIADRAPNHAHRHRVHLVPALIRLFVDG